MGLLFLLLSIIPQPDGVLRESVDVIEVNHHYDHEGKIRHSQLIFWDWHWNVVIPAQAAEYDQCTCVETCPAHEAWQGSRFHVVDWRLLRGDDMRPQRDWLNGGYRCFWNDKGPLRDVRAPSIRETWTQDQFERDHFSDVERYEKEHVLLEGKRRKLKETKPTKPWVHETPAEANELLRQ